MKDIKIKKTESQKVRIKGKAIIKALRQSERDEALHKIKDEINKREDENDATSYATDKVEDAMRYGERRTEAALDKTRTFAVNKAKEKLAKKKDGFPKENEEVTEAGAKAEAELTGRDDDTTVDNGKIGDDDCVNEETSISSDEASTDVIKTDEETTAYSNDKTDAAKKYKQTTEYTEKKRPVKSSNESTRDVEFKFSNEWKSETDAAVKSHKKTDIKIRETAMCDRERAGNADIKVKTEAADTKIRSRQSFDIQQRKTSENVKKVGNKVEVKTNSRKINNASDVKHKRKLKNPVKAMRDRARRRAQAKAAQKAAREAADKSIKAIKASAKVIKEVSIKVAQALVVAAKAITSIAAYLGGWIVLLILLIVIIIMAAIAASPFGIFLTEEASDENSIPISAIVAECNNELSQEIEAIEESYDADEVVIDGEGAEWDLILALFSVKVAGAEDDSLQDVVIIDEGKKNILKGVFWDITVIEYDTETVMTEDENETTLYITISSKTKNEMVSEYRFSEKQKEALETLLENSDVLNSAIHSLVVADATAKDVINNLPDDLSAERKAVIKAACSLVGKVNYFWGGKSTATGWDSEWGKLKKVTASGSSSTGTTRPFGLDCSGFVTWCFINSGFRASQIGHGTSGQLTKSIRINWTDAEIGDLAFYSDHSHVGIIAGRDEDGNILVIHCSSGANNVVITTKSGFGFAARTNCY